MPHNGLMRMWTIRLKVLPDGGVTVDDVSYGVPAGEIEVRGGDDGNRVALEARQRDPQGRFVVSAHHRRDRAEETLHQAEAMADDLETAVTEAVAEAAAIAEAGGMQRTGDSMAPVTRPGIR